jgi:hypothetical protein
MKHQATTPKPPDAWLGIIRESDGLEWVYERSESTKDPEFLKFVSEFEDFPYTDCRSLVVAKDSPSLRVRECRSVILSPADLTSRDNWFERWANVLEPHLRDPRRAHVFTFAPGQLMDPLATHKSTPQGPFPFPKGQDWPTCGVCHSRLAFVCVLDFRHRTDAKLPGASLVYHLCQSCGPCQDDYANRITWLAESNEIEIHGEPAGTVEIGTVWEATEYPTPTYWAEEIDAVGEFRREQQIYFNFSCFGDKIGGHVFWIQGDETPKDSAGQPMKYIGQSFGSRQIDIGDCGLVYFFYSETSRETKMAMQCF